MSRIPIELQSGAKTKAIEIEPLNSSILGLERNVEGDSLEISEDHKRKLQALSQKELYFLMYHQFFPVGLSASYTMQMKILLKTLWKQTRQKWDKPLQNEVVLVFGAWAEEEKLVEDLSLRRQ